MGQLSFASMTVKTKKIKVEKFLDEMNKIIPWTELIAIIKPFYSQKGNGRPPMNLLLMIKIHCLQQWYNLVHRFMKTLPFGLRQSPYNRRSQVGAY